MSRGRKALPPTMCWKCRYSNPYPENKWRCIWEESKANVIPDYVLFKATRNSTDKSICIIECDKFESDPHFNKKVDKSDKKKIKKMAYNYSCDKRCMIDEEQFREVLEDRGLQIKTIAYRLGLEYSTFCRHIHNWYAISVEKLNEIERFLGVPENSLRKK